MTWVYLSPHFDDVALSCGGLVWEQSTDHIPVEVWTICSGELPGGQLTPFAESLHNRWQVTALEAINRRRAEDAAAMLILGASTRSFNLLDCIYRRLPDGSPLVEGEEDLWQPIHPEEKRLVDRLAMEMGKWLPEETILVSPYGLGNHVDHRITRAAAELLYRDRRIEKLAYYADYPYVIRMGARLEQLSTLEEQVSPISDLALAAWQAAVAAYTSQISTFWDGMDEMRAAIQAYCMDNQGVKLFFPNQE